MPKHRVKVIGTHGCQKHAFYKDSRGKIKARLWDALDGLPHDAAEAVAQAAEKEAHRQRKKHHLQRIECR